MNKDKREEEEEEEEAQRLLLRLLSLAKLKEDLPSSSSGKR